MQLSGLGSRSLPAASGACPAPGCSRGCWRAGIAQELRVPAGRGSRTGLGTLGASSSCEGTLYNTAQGMPDIAPTPGVTVVVAWLRRAQQRRWRKDLDDPCGSFPTQDIPGSVVPEPKFPVIGSKSRFAGVLLEGSSVFTLEAQI